MLRLTLLWFLFIHLPIAANLALRFRGPGVTVAVFSSCSLCKLLQANSSNLPERAAKMKLVCNTQNTAFKQVRLNCNRSLLCQIVFPVLAFLECWAQS